MIQILFLTFQKIFFDAWFPIFSLLFLLLKLNYYVAQKCMCVFVHLFYFWLIYKIVELRKLTLLYVHHCNFVSFLFNFHYIIYYHYIHPYFDDPKWIDITCTISEVFWAMLKLLRTYSILLIAVYRAVAVFKVNLYKKMNSSWVYIMIPLGVDYLICALIYLATKYGYQTKYGYLYCFDGFSPIFYNSISYFGMNALIGILLPVIASVVLYHVIQAKLNKLSRKVGTNGSSSSKRARVGTSAMQASHHRIERSEASSATTNTMHHSVSVSYVNTISLKPNGDESRQVSSSTKKDYSRQRNLAKQFLIMDICEIASSIMVIGLGMRYLIPNLNEYYNIARFLLRSFNLLFQSLVPVAAMYYNPDICKKLKHWKRHYLGFCFNDKANDTKKSQTKI